MDNPYSTFASGINNTVEANQFNPQALNQEVAQDSKKAVFQQDLIKLISAEILNKQRADMENAVTLAANPPEGTVADREFGKLTQTTESDVAQRIAAVDQQKAAEKNKRLAALTKGGPQGINGLDNSIPAMAAGNRGGLVAAAMHRPTMNYTRGGLVSFDNGGGVEGEDDSWYDIEGGLFSENTTGDLLVDTPVGEMVELAEDNIIATIALAVLGGRVKRVQKAGKGFIQMGKNVYKDAVDIYKQTSRGSKQRNQRMRDRGVKTLYGAGAGTAGIEALNTELSSGQTPPEVEEEVAPVPTTFEIDPTQLDLPDPSAPLTDAIDREREALKTKSDEAQGMLDAAETRGDTDAAARKDLTDALTSSGEAGIAGLTTSRDDVKEAGEQNLRWLIEGQGKTREAQQKVIDDIKEMAATAKGGRREMFEDLLLGLSKVGQGRNITEGLANSYQTMVDRGEAREQTARGLDEKAITEEKNLGGLYATQANQLGVMNLNSAEGVAAADARLNTFIQNNQQLLMATDADTRMLGVANQANMQKLRTLLSETRVAEAGLAYKTVVAEAEQLVRISQMALNEANIKKMGVANVAATLTAVGNALEAVYSKPFTEVQDSAHDQEVLNLRNNLQTVTNELLRQVGLSGGAAGAGTAAKPNTWAVEKD